jgi:hypothetical protein
LLRWSLLLQQFVFEIVYKAGKTHHVDGLSRIPYLPTPEDIHDEVSNDDLSFSTLSAKQPVEPDIIRDDANEFTTEIKLVFREDQSGHATSTARDKSQQVESSPCTDEVKLEICSMDDLPQRQRDCEDLGRLIRYLESGELPPDDKLARQTVFEANEFVMDDNTLYHHSPQKDKALREDQPFIKRIAVPKTLRNEVLQAYHDGCNHVGIDRCLAGIATCYWWPKMYADVKLYCHSCTSCQEHNRQYNVKRAPLQPLPTEDLFS